VLVGLTLENAWCIIASTKVRDLLSTWLASLERRDCFREGLFSRANRQQLKATQFVFCTVRFAGVTLGRSALAFQ